MPGSAGSGGALEDDTLQWTILVLEPNEQAKFSFRVLVQGSGEIVNAEYGVLCAEGVGAVGEPVITYVEAGGIYLPQIMRSK